MLIKVPPPGTPLQPGWLQFFAKQIETSMRVVPGAGIEVNLTQAGQVVSAAGAVDRLELARITAAGGSPPVYSVAGVTRRELVLEGLTPAFGRPAGDPVAAQVGDPCFLVRVPGEGWRLWITTERVSDPGIDPGGRTSVDVEILGAFSVGTNKWRYGGRVVAKTGTGHGGWEDTGELVVLYNRMESNNDASGVEGNGVDVGALPPGWSLRPLATGAIVDAEPYEIEVEGETVTEHWCTVTNAIDGACE